MTGFLAQLVAEARALWQRLSTARKVLIFGGTLVAVVGLSWAAYRGYDYGQAQDTFASRNLPGVAPRPVTDEDLAPPADASASDLLEAIKQPMFPNQGIVEVTIREHKRQRIMRAILWNSRIASCNLEVQEGPKSRKFSLTRRGSASIQVSLARGTAVLTSGEARSIRQMVSDSYDLDVERVTLTDDHGHDYRRDWNDDSDSEEYHRADLQRDIVGCCSQLFEPGEFTLFVDVKTAPTPDERDEDEEGGLGRSRRPDDIESVRVIVRFERGAVLERYGDEVEFKRSYQEAIAAIVGSIEHSVVVQVLDSSSARRVASDSVEAALPTSVDRATADSVAGVFLGWWSDARIWMEARSPTAELALTGVCVGLALLIVWSLIGRRRARSGRQRKAAQGARGEARARGTRKRSGSHGLSPRDTPEGSEAATPDSFLSAIERTSAWVNERPQAAASVLRVWLAQDEDVAERVGDV